MRSLTLILQCRIYTLVGVTLDCFLVVLSVRRRRLNIKHEEGVDLVEVVLVEVDKMGYDRVRSR